MATLDMVEPDRAGSGTTYVFAPADPVVSHAADSKAREALDPVFQFAATLIKANLKGLSSWKSMRGCEMSPSEVLSN